MDDYSKFKNIVSHKVHSLKSSAANDISIIFFSIKNLPGKSCGPEKNTCTMQAVY